jgi:hypothetical protein
MSELVVGLESDVRLGMERPGLPDSLRRQLLNLDGWNVERDAMQMRNDWLQAERDEIVEYVRTLKKLALYMNAKSSTGDKPFPKISFENVEKNLPDYLREEIDVSTYA